ncbi:glutamyl-tRNA synthetase [Nakamurella panacisegetis]|uniref:Glutamyl-Q tRNA(Asp) synthetase n=1 Tax=Nakamurella panacisegetis TaxID=1090615 RepID=A0A1H0MM63_9ACTN|nr:tRNA glutamyl-Q(34) synthetase GluQRS [Nakamurella panacisegetis]SDO81424.1 glutamyl-tRNA synthetase [Nakamurella panacisegetis]
MDPVPGAGRFAPSPSGDLHVGNLRTAVLAWLFARTTGRSFRLRVENLDRVAPGAQERQLNDLTALGLDWDGPVVRQSDRHEVYTAAITRLEQDGLTYECFCTRREIQEAAAAPHGPEGAYPGTCRNLTAPERGERRQAGRRSALRLRAEAAEWTVHDDLLGDLTGPVDDLVLRRTDGVVAYNLAVVVDDAAAGVDQVVRGDDLLTSAPRQAFLGHLLGLPQPTYAHVPLALNIHGARLAKRDGAVTLTDLRALGRSPGDVLGVIARSLDLAEPGEDVTMTELAARFDPTALPRHPWVFDPGGVRPSSR